MGQPETARVDSQNRQVEALDKLAVAAEAIARDLASYISDSLKVVLVYPWSNDPSVFRAVLVQGADEERRLTEALPRFESSKDAANLEDWLRQEHFKPLKTARLSLGRRAHETFQARSFEPGPQPPGRELPEIPEKLELESSGVASAELQSPSSMR